MNRYFKYRREEDRGDEFSDEVYDKGPVLKYDENHLEDEFGMLADKTIDEEALEEPDVLEISKTNSKVNG